MSEKKGSGFWALLIKGGTTLLKGAKLLKVIFAAATFASYAYLFTWKFALMVLIAIGFHESGHVWAMKKTGMKTKGFYFLPFLGGVAIGNEAHKSQAQHAFIAIMGPVWGFALAAATYVAYLVTHQPVLAAVASWMALVNLFNLLPVNPLDGGQILRTITFSVNNTLGIVFLGLSIVLGIACAIKFNIGLFYVLLIAAALDFIGEIASKIRNARRRAELQGYLTKNPENEWWVTNDLKSLEEIPAMTTGQVLLTGGSYVGLILALFAVMFATSHVPGADIALLLLQD